MKSSRAMNEPQASFCQDLECLLGFKVEAAIWFKSLKTPSAKPPRSSTTMSTNFDSPRKGQVPNLIQFYSWDAVTAHNKRARIHIWRKKSRKILRRNFVNFVGHGRPGKAFLHPTAPSGKGLSLLAINRELSEKYILFIF